MRQKKCRESSEQQEYFEKGLKYNICHFSDVKRYRMQINRTDWKNLKKIDWKQLNRKNSALALQLPMQEKVTKMRKYKTRPREKNALQVITMQLQSPLHCCCRNVGMDAIHWMAPLASYRLLFFLLCHGMDSVDDHHCNHNIY